MAKELKRINFSSGIRGEAINDNFETLEDQVGRERLAIAGHGISSGLEMTVEDFNVNISAGSVIVNTGEEAFLDAVTLPIEYPRLKNVVKESYLVEDGGIISLPNRPYCTHRRGPVTTTSLYNGISITSFTNELEVIRFRAVLDNQIFIDDVYSNSLVNISYSYTYKRYDTIYINNDKELKVFEGTSSSSPSIVIPEDSLYVLGYVEVDPFYHEDGEEKAKLLIKQDLRNLRNLFTDKDNKLFICGVPFEDLQIIHMTQPDSPFENQLWYDGETNTLKVYKTHDGIASWQNVNDYSSMPVEESKMWVPSTENSKTQSSNPADKKTFLFHKDEVNLRFIPGIHCLDVRIDQNILHKDQFKELTLEDAKTNIDLRNELLRNYGYNQAYIDKVNSEYENIGIGFELTTALDDECFVEVLVQQRIQQSPLFKRFQRSATFVDSNYFRINDNDNKVFTVATPYRYKEHQLTLFLNGDKLVNEIDYKEGDVDEYTYEDEVLVSPVKGEQLLKFTLIKNAAPNSILEYEITTSIYSYDSVDSIMGGISGSIDEAAETAKEAKQIAEDVTENFSTELINIKENIETTTILKDKVNTLESKFPIEKKDIDKTMFNYMNNGLINFSVKKTLMDSLVISDLELTPNDFITMFDTSIGGKILRRKKDDNPSADGDYYLERDVAKNVTKVKFSSSTTVLKDAIIYITGISFTVR